MEDDTERELAACIRACGIGERVVLNPLGRRVVDDAELNLLFNACDVGITTTMGEGWGQVSCEHGAAGGAQIVPDHTAPAELWRGRGELIPPARFYTPEFSPLEMGEVSPEGAAHALDTLYRDPARAQALARAAATENPAPPWDVVAGKFDDLIEALARDTKAI
jgi:glycosyltransferase involved in cell wall biosynthesis